MLYVYAVCVTCDLCFPLGINKVFLHLLWMKALGLSTDSPSIDITAQPRRPNGNRTWTGSRRTWREACGCGTCSGPTSQTSWRWCPSPTAVSRSSGLRSPCRWWAGRRRCCSPPGSGCRRRERWRIRLRLYSTHSHTNGGVNHASRQPARRDHFGLGALLRGTSTHDRTSNLAVTRQPTLPPEVLPPHV